MKKRKAPFLRPRIFISYAREDEEAAKAVEGYLHGAGFLPFLDQHSIETGTLYQNHLETSLRRADGVVFLVSCAFAGSDWCQAELHAAGALKKKLLPFLLVAMEDAGLSVPANAVLGRVQGLPAANDTEVRQAVGRLGREHRSLVWRPWLRLLKVLAAAGVSLWLLFFAVHLVIEDNRRNTAAERHGQIEQQVREAAQGLSEKNVKLMVQELPEPLILADSLFSRAMNPNLPPLERLNAFAVANAINRERHPLTRLYFSDLNWTDGGLSNASIPELTLSAGTVAGLSLENCVLTDVCWVGSGGTPPRLLKVTNLKAKNCRMLGNLFKECEMMDAALVNCQLKGCELDVTQWIDTRISLETKTSSPHEVTADFALLQKCVVINNRTPPKGALDFSDRVMEVTFAGVTFEDTEFRGWVRPEWFQKCAFFHCRFPSPDFAEKLRAAGHNVLDEPF